MQVDIAENSQPEFLSFFNLEVGEQRSFSQTTMTADIKILDTLESKVQIWKVFFNIEVSNEDKFFILWTKLKSIFLYYLLDARIQHRI